MKPLTRITILFAMLIMLLSLAFGSAVSASDTEQTFQQPILVVNTSFLNVRTGPGAQYTILVTVVGGTELPVLGQFTDGVWYEVATDGGPGWVNVTFTLPRGDFTNVPILELGQTGAPNVDLGQGGGAVATTNIATTATAPRFTGVNLLSTDLRTQPTEDSIALTTSAPIDNSVIYPLINTTVGAGGVTWYQVDVPGIGIGWTDRVNLRLLACNNDVVGVINGNDIPITFERISTRDSFTLDLGTEGFIGAFVDQTNTRVFFELVDGTVGIVNRSSISERTDVTNVCDNVPTIASTLGQGGGAVDASTTTQGTNVTIPQIALSTVIVNTGFLNIRSGPNAGYSIVATVPGGTELSVLGRAEDNVWYLVQGDFGQGWLNNQFVLFRGDFSTVPLIDELVLIGEDGLPTNLGQGGGAALSTSVATGRSVTGVTLVGKDMHEQPTYDSIIINSSVPTDPTTVYPLLATQQDSNGTLWYLVDVPFVGRGWMDLVDFRPLECAADSVGVLHQEANIVFDGFSNQDSYLLPVGIEFFITGRRGEQAIIELMDGTAGLVRAEAVSPRTGVTSVCDGVTATVSSTTLGTTSTAGVTTTTTIPQVTGNRVVVNTGNLNVRSGPGAGFSTVATVPGATELAVIGRATDGVWLFVEGTFGQGWVNSQFVLFRGNYASVPVLDLSGN